MNMLYESKEVRGKYRMVSVPERVSMGNFGFCSPISGLFPSCVSCS